METWVPMRNVGFCRDLSDFAHLPLSYVGQSRQGPTQSRWDETWNIRSFVLSIFVALRSSSYPLSRRLQRSEAGWHTKCLMLRPSTKKEAIGPPQTDESCVPYLSASIRVHFTPENFGAAVGVFLDRVRVLKFAPSAIMADDWVCQT